ncbi:MAG: radical SAM protein [Polyangiaceae bacterium]|nr:radical SAM protein [Polyangiaceae bacterium]
MVPGSCCDTSEQSWHPYARLERRLRTCVWDITQRCNLRCVHCENRSGPGSPRELTLTEMLRVGDSLARLGCEFVDITGGEPLTFRGWDRLVRHLAVLGMRVSLITNGLLLDERRLAMAVAAGVGLVVVSLDGTEEIHDATRLRLGSGPSPFRLAIEGLVRAQRVLPVAVLTQINRQNVHDLPALHRQLRELHVRRWQVQLAVPAGRLLDHEVPYVIAPADLPRVAAWIEAVRRRGGPPDLEVSDNIGYYTASERWIRQRGGRPGLWLGCVAGLRSATITYEGRVRGCSMMPAEFDAGDLHEESLESIWEDRSRFAYTLDYDPRRLTGACGHCKFGPVCRAGCTTMAYYSTGSIYENPYCLHRLESSAVLSHPTPNPGAFG